MSVSSPWPVLSVVRKDPASTSPSDSMTVGSTHGAITYLAVSSASVWYACRNEVQNVTSPVTPMASAPPSTAACSCGSRSGVPGAAVIVSNSTPALPNTMPPSWSAAWVAEGTSMTIMANFSKPSSLACWANAPSEPG